MRLLLCAALLTVVAPADYKQPTVFIAVLARNKEHTLPYFLTHLERLNYPRDRLTLYIKSDHNQDRTPEVLRKWLDQLEKDTYHEVIVDIEECRTAPDCLAEGETAPVGWPDKRFRRMMEMREAALGMARRRWADFVWMLDADVFLANPDVLSFLVEQEKAVAAPMLPSVGLYSNFWAGMSDSFYYLRTDDYKKILERKELGCFQVPMVHSAVLVNLMLEESDRLTYLPENVKDYPGPPDDIIVFALSARLGGVPLHVCNEHNFGVVMLPLDDGHSLADDRPNLLNALLEVTVNHGPLETLGALSGYSVQPPAARTRLGFSQVYLVNLRRRPDRLARMAYNFEMLGIDYKLAEAVDGKSLDEAYLAANGIKMMPDFSEPYHHRPLTYGEIGCFMSHYKIWQEMLENNEEVGLIFEDDIRFEPFFVAKLRYLLEELQTTDVEWDLVFLGRKILQNADEPWVEGSQQLVYVDYSYWTLSYILSRRGAQKLVDGRPLSKMVPVDEYLPIMYDRHPNSTWKRHYSPRDLKALSAAPLLVYPTHYTGEEGYISDTEATGVIRPTTQACGDSLLGCPIKDEV